MFRRRKLAPGTIQLGARLIRLPSTLPSGCLVVGLATSRPGSLYIDAIMTCRERGLTLGLTKSAPPWWRGSA